MSDQATPLVMAQHTHRSPDGSRRLIIGRRTNMLRVAQSKHRQTCHTMVVDATFGHEPRRSCQRVIVPGLFFLIYQPRHPSTDAPGSIYRFCTPCAITEWAKWHVGEDIA